MPLFDVHFLCTTRTTQYGSIVVEAPNSSLAKKYFVTQIEEDDLYTADTAMTYTVDSVRQVDHE